MVWCNFADEVVTEKTRCLQSVAQSWTMKWLLDADNGREILLLLRTCMNADPGVYARLQMLLPMLVPYLSVVGLSSIVAGALLTDDVKDTYVLRT